MSLKRFCLASLLCLVLPVGLLAAQGPSERIDAYIDKVLQVFQDPGICQKDCQNSPELKKKLSELGNEIFDFRIMSMMSLGRHWKQLTDQEQNSFVHLFQKLLEENYFGKIVTHFEEIQTYSKDKVEIVGETLFSSRKAEVQSLILHEGKKIPVDYRLVQQNEMWRIYDVSVEGVSLIGNYRKQFDEILFKKNPQQMLESLRRKVDDAAASGSS